MKNLKKIIVMGLTAALCAVSLAGCGGAQNGGTDGATDTNAKDTYKIGVLQYADHPSLDNCREGFKQGLDSEGIKYDITESSAKGDEYTNRTAICFTRYGPCMRYRNTVCTGLLQCGL